MFKRKRPPQIVYKYYGAERTSVFEAFLVRFSQLAALNDPFEFLISAKPGDFRRGLERVVGGVANPFSVVALSISAAWKAIQENEQARAAPLWLRFLIVLLGLPLMIILMVLLSPFLAQQLRKAMLAMGDQVEELVFRRVREGLVLVFSCSETWKSVPMWAHYAGNHTGFALGLDSTRAFPDGRPKRANEFLKPRQVRYLKREPRLNPATLDIGDFITAKMDHWSYEREWRFVSVSDDATMRGDIVGGHELLLYRLEPQSIREVIFGANCNEDTVTTILEKLEAASVRPRLFQVRRGVGYGFERAEIATASDLHFENLPNGPVPNVRSHSRERIEQVLEEFRTDVEKDRFARRFFGFSGRG